MISSLAPDRGFGFITDDAGDEFFFHRGALTATDFEELAEGVAVEFEVKNDEKGDEPGERPRAVNVRLADDAVPAVDNELLPSEKVR
jgi:cold shock CspA family protein